MSDPWPQYRPAILNGKKSLHLVVGADGTFWRTDFPRESDRVLANWKPRKLRQFGSKVVVTVQVDGREHRYDAAQAICDTYDKRPSYPQQIVGYLDGNPFNLELGNLTWVAPVNTSSAALMTLRRLAATRVIGEPAFKDWMKVIRPVEIETKLPSPLVPAAAPVTRQTGTAVDYLLRFLIHSIRPEIPVNRYLAESVPKAFTWGPTDQHFDINERINEAHEVVEHGLGVLRQLKESPNDPDRLFRAAETALRYALLDTNFRGGMVLPDYWTVHPEHASEVVEIVAKVPLKTFERASRIELNPNFGTASRAIGGADADLIVDGRLIDIKTTAKKAFERSDIDQIFLYSMLRRWQVNHGCDGQSIENICLLFPRQGVEVIWPLSLWQEHTRYHEFEAGLFAWISEGVPVPKTSERSQDRISGVERFQITVGGESRWIEPPRTSG
ncbi:MAG: hypothetical protein KDA83_18150 [Planctomycetales bacterium]|nr:hypothetical protein [Planctomycetales bacterium]